ncbi:MAG: barstar family protein [Burkholderiales bacterium]|nr:barstar family protein [Burkholderiales bacterium]
MIITTASVESGISAEALAARLREHRKSGVFRAVVAPPALETAAHDAGLAFIALDAGSARTKSQFLGLLGRTLSFPNWFGRNWDALEDCLTDASWMPESGLVIRAEGFHSFAEADPDGFAILLDIFKTSAEYWRGEGRAFWTLFVGAPAADLELPVLIV